MAISKKAQQRLGRLIRLMEKLPKSAEDHFYMGKWFGHHGDHSHRFGKELTRSALLRNCGTTACALGWAATDPYFKKLGVRIRFDKDGEMTGWGKTGRDYAHTVSVRAFDIDFQQHGELFESGLHVRSPKDWAKRARSLLRKWAA